VRKAKFQDLLARGLVDNFSMICVDGWDNCSCAKPLEVVSPWKKRQFC